MQYYVARNSNSHCMIPWVVQVHYNSAPNPSFPFFRLLLCHIHLSTAYNHFILCLDYLCLKSVTSLNLKKNIYKIPEVLPRTQECTWSSQMDEMQEEQNSCLPQVHHPFSTWL